MPLLKLVPPEVERLLDIGCNTGEFGRSLKSSRHVEVWGVEPDLQSAGVAKERLDRVIADYFQQDNPIPDNYFDLVTFNDSLEHMIDPAEALQLSKRKLRQHGRVQCCVPNIRYIGNLEHLILEKDWRYEESGIRDRTHLRFFTEKSIIRLFENTGFRVVTAVGINEKWWERDKLARRLLFRFFPHWTRDMRHVEIVVIAEPQSVTTGLSHLNR
jgi:SAM-dependent methyltransferase